MARLSILCQINGGCMGCCGHDFISKEKIEEAIERNTKDFESLNPKTEQELISFMNRAHSNDLLNGVCRNLIRDEKTDKVLCPLHPALNDGNDLRVGHCQTEYLCLTAQKFEKWDDLTKERFLDFVKKKKLDRFDYSLAIDRNELVKEFEENN